MRMYTAKRLYSVIASLAPFKGRFRASAGCNMKNTLKIEPLHILIMIKSCTRVDSSCQMAEKQLRRPLQVFGAELKTFRSSYFMPEELRYPLRHEYPLKMEHSYSSSIYLL